jgi:hypothetical protein
MQRVYGLAAKRGVGSTIQMQKPPQNARFYDSNANDNYRTTDVFAQERGAQRITIVNGSQP